MRVTIDGYPATIDIPPGHHLLDAVIVARVVEDADPREDHLIIGATDHTSNMVRHTIIEHTEYAADHEWADHEWGGDGD